jgi:hypothetical protein
MGATSSQRTSQVPGFSMIQHFVVVAIATSGSVRSSDLSCARGLITAERHLKLSKAFTLIGRGPVVLVTTTDGGRDNVMTISWTMVLAFTPVFAITTGEWNFS